MRTVPVNQSAGPLLDGCEPTLFISISIFCVGVVVWARRIAGKASAAAPVTFRNVRRLSIVVSVRRGLDGLAAINGHEVVCCGGDAGREQKGARSETGSAQPSRQRIDGNLLREMLVRGLPPCGAAESAGHHENRAFLRQHPCISRLGMKPQAASDPRRAWTCPVSLRKASRRTQSRDARALISAAARLVPQGRPSFERGETPLALLVAAVAVHNFGFRGWNFRWHPSSPLCSASSSNSAI